MNDNFLLLRVVYDDLPDLIEIAVDLRHDGGVARSTAYASPNTFKDYGAELAAWSYDPIAPIRIEIGADIGIGWFVLEFFTVDRAGHVRCAVRLATNQSRPGESWRCSLEMPTELGLVEKFARQCMSLGDIGTQATLIGLPE